MIPTDFYAKVVAWWWWRKKTNSHDARTPTKSSAEEKRQRTANGETGIVLAFVSIGTHAHVGAVAKSAHIAAAEALSSFPPQRC